MARPHTSALLLVLLAAPFAGCATPDEGARDAGGATATPVMTPVVTPVLTPVATPAATPPASPTSPTRATPPAAATPTPPSPAFIPEALRFAPDAGFRMPNASNAGVRWGANGSVELIYEDRVDRRREWATSADGLDFTTMPGAQPTGFRGIRLPNGTYRAYVLQEGVGLASISSADGSNWTSDPGVRYVLTPEDRGRMGIYDVHVDDEGGVVLLYLGDMMGKNNVRRAYSTDGGWTFSFTNGNVFGDEDAGGGPRSHVDQKLVEMPDGSVRAFVMKAGVIYSFTSRDDAKTFTLDAGVRLRAEDFGPNYVSLHDPQPLLLPDGRVRVYVTVAVGTPGQPIPDGPDAVQHLVSATSAG